MRSGSPCVSLRVAGLLAALTALALMLVAAPAGAARLQPPGPVVPDEAARAAEYWTPERMASTPPLGSRLIPFGGASASFLQVKEPTVAPNTVNGRLFVRQGRSRGFCSATAINSPSRSLVLTAAHCLNSGPRGRRGTSAWSHYLEFVPAYSGGVAPFGAFVAHRRNVYVPRQWVKFANPNFDVGALVVTPNADGANVADAVGGGATIVLDRSRKQRFETFGYPGKTKWMQGCRSPYVGDDSATYRIPGPPTIAIRCHWAPGASGGGWLVDGGLSINGLTSYAKRLDNVHTFGPYFSQRNVGNLVAGL